MDIGAVTAEPTPAQRNGGRGLAQGSNTPIRQREHRTLFDSGKISHLIQGCKRMQKAKELGKSDWEVCRKSSQQDEKKQLGNSQAPTQHVELWQRL